MEVPRLSSLLLEVLDGPLRPWAGTPASRVVVGIRCTYVELEGGFCGLAATPRGSGPVSEPLPEYVTPRLLARRADSGPVDAALAWAAASAVTSAWVEETPRAVSVKAVERVLRGLGGAVLALGLTEWAYKLLKSYGLRVVEQRAEGPAAAVLGDYVLFDRQELARALSLSEGLRRVLVGLAPSVHPLAAARLGASAVVGVYVPRPLCRRVGRFVEEGRGVEGLQRYLVVWASEALAGVGAGQGLSSSC